MEELTRKEEQILLAVHFLKDDAILNTIKERIKQYSGKNYSLGTIYVPLNRLHNNGYKPLRFPGGLRKGGESFPPMQQRSRLW